ncbi:phospholipase carboxylesterase family protein [Cryptosporidium andersoni]|uniref:Phospholipase carboxylesterase family protein n=1 Tax=Cryptosporidium andersoni TaxID=117008 RepID=A0A1J4MIT4_9CRYT|nr:phospholipase carboxylesterase family protein [Cryptosporidium andersoni]
MIEKGDGYGGEGYNYVPEYYNSVFIWLHGRGDTADSFLRYIQIFQQYKSLRRTKIILLTAPIISLTYLEGYPFRAWFDMLKFEPLFPEEPEHLFKTSSRIINIVLEEIEKGIKSSRIGIGGFSQGAASSYFIALSSIKCTFGFCIVVGGWLPLINNFCKKKEVELLNNYITFEVTDDVKKNTKFLILHGESDPRVPLFWSKRCQDIVLSIIKPKNYQNKIYPNIGHTISIRMENDFLEFMAKCLEIC